MEFLKRKIYQYTEIADMIVQDALDHSYSIIAVTGTSSVGKSTFSNMILEHFQRYGFSAQIISADNYLKKVFQAGTNFWNRLDSTYLKPEHFDWNLLANDLKSLKNSHPIHKECYVRGTGWGILQTFHPTEYYIIEGLFLDSVQASDNLDYDFLVSLTADEHLIRTLRIERDAYYRRTSPAFKRTEDETLLEIENTLLAGKSYSVSTHWKRYLSLHAKGSYNATIHLINNPIV